MELKTISVVMSVNKLEINGMSSVIMNYCRYLNREKYKITIMAGKPIDNVYKDECAKLGVEIIELPTKTKSPMKYYFNIFKILNKKKFDIIHIHGNSSMMAVELLIASVKGIKKRIAHCHNTSCSSVTVHKILLPIFNRLYVIGLACSDHAGKWLFGKKEYTVILNGFDYSKFLYDKEARASIRRELRIGQDLIIGHIGRMNNQKNQEYLLKVFAAVCRKRKDVLLMLVGVGPNFEEVKKLVEGDKNREKIILYGETTTPEKLYSTFDIFAFPSKFEGFGMVMTEAQVNGIPCIASTNVPDEVVISDKISFLPIGIDDVDLWADKILELLQDSIENDRTKIDQSKIVKFDINQNVKQLEQCYERM